MSTDEAMLSQQSGRGIMILQCNGKNLQSDEERKNLPQSKKMKLHFRIVT